MIHFLCTTALREFWGPDTRHKLFLGPWCTAPYAPEKLPEKSNTILHPWQDMDTFYASIPEEEAIVQSCTAALAKVLDEIHGTTHGLRYWQIVLTPWVYDCVMSLHERFISIRTALASEKAWETICLNEDAFVVPGSSAEFTELIVSDAFNLQLYSIILNQLGHSAPTQSTPITKPSNDSTLKNRIRGIVSSTLTRFALRGDTAVLIGNLMPNNVLKMYATSLFSVRPSPCAETKLPQRTWSSLAASTSRQKVGLLLPLADTAFAKVLSALLPVVLPCAFLEYYQSLRSKALDLLGKKLPKSIISSANYHNNDLLRVIMAEAALSGTRLIVAQHGGSYGSGLVNTLEIIEGAVADEYWTWGWKSPSYHTVQVPSPKLSNLQKRSTQSTDANLLFVGNRGPRYYYRKHSLPVAHQMIGYLADQVSFLAALSPDIFDSVLLRAYPSQGEWNIINSLSKRFPSLKFDTSGNYRQRITSARLVVCDIDTTTLLERLSLRSPLIAYIDPSVCRLRPEAIPLYEGLRTIGILYSSPEEAASAINSIWPKLDIWWATCLKSKEYEVFTKHYTLHSTHWERDWIEASKCPSNQITTLRSNNAQQ